MTGDTMEVRRAGASEVSAVATMLADAFAGYVWDVWTVAADRHHERVAAVQALFLERVVVPYGELWIVDEAGDPVAAAAWMRPGVVIPDQVWRELAPLLSEQTGDRTAAAAAADAASAPLRPAGPHYYLASLGVRRDRQGRGLGSRLLRPVLATCDRSGADAYVETSSEGNVRFYERLGFGVTGEADVPGGGPHIWAMLRSPNG